MIIDAQQLREAVSAAVCDRSTLGILQFIRVRTEADGRLSLCSTNLEQEREDWLPFRSAVDVYPPPTEVAVCIMGSKLKAALQGLDGDVELSLGVPASSLKQGRRRYQLESRDAADFQATTREARTPLTLDTAELGKALPAVLYARARPGRDSGRPYLAGVHIGGGWVECTNGHQVARRKLDVADGLPEQGVILPGDSAPGMAKLLAEPGATVALLGSTDYPRGLEVATETTRLTSKLIEAQYPNIDRVLPTGEAAARFAFDAAAAGPCLARMLPLAERQFERFRASAIGLRIQPGADAVEVFAGEHTHDLFEAEHLDGALDQSGLNGAYLAETCKAEHGRLEVQAFEGPVAHIFLLSGVGEHVIMGMRL